MKYLILILLASNIAQAQLSCVDLFESRRLLTEEEINIRIIELVNLKSQALREGGAAKILFNNRFNMLATLISKEEIVNRMRVVSLNKPEAKIEKSEFQKVTATKNEVLTNEILVAEFLKEAETLIANGENPLYLAVQAYRPDLIDAFLQLGYDINVKNKDGKTPIFGVLDLHGSQQNSMLSLLLERGANPYATRSFSNGRSESFMEAVMYSRIDPNALQVLVSANINMNVVDQAGNQPIHLLAKSGPSTFREKLEILLQSNVDINSKNSDGLTPLDLVKRWPGKSGFDLLNRIEEVDYLKKNMGAKESQYFRNRVDNIIHTNIGAYAAVYYYTSKRDIINYGTKLKNRIQQKIKREESP